MAIDPEYCVELLVYMHCKTLESAETQAQGMAERIRDVYGFEVIVRLVEAQSPEATMRKAIEKACTIIEMGDQRLTALDGPCGNLPPVLSLAEWRELYVTLDEARKRKRSGGRAR